MGAPRTVAPEGDGVQSTQGSPKKLGSPSNLQLRQAAAEAASGQQPLSETGASLSRADSTASSKSEGARSAAAVPASVGSSASCGSSSASTSIKSNQDLDTTAELPAAAAAPRPPVATFDMVVKAFDTRK